MKCTFSCKKVNLSDSVKAYTEKKLSKLDRFFRETPSAAVTFSVEKEHCALLRSPSAAGPLCCAPRRWRRMVICAVPWMRPAAISSGRS